jgi:hypothetical protein
MAKMQKRHWRLRMPKVPHTTQATIRGHMTYMPTAKTIRKNQNIALMALWGVALTTFPAQAQQLSFPWVGVTTTQSAATITNGGTFQTVLASNPNRKGCLIQNISAHVMSIYMGALADATSGKSITIPATTGVFYCNLGPAVMTDNINVTTSTTSDAFVVLSVQ